MNSIIIKVESILARLDGYRAANALSESLGQTPEYGFAAFLVESEELESLAGAQATAEHNQASTMQASTVQGVRGAAND
jgi:hypothetical protein